MVEAKNRDTLSLLAMSDTEEEDKEENSKETILARMDIFGVDNDIEQEKTNVYFSNHKPNLKNTLKENLNLSLLFL